MPSLHICVNSTLTTAGLDRAFPRPPPGWPGASKSAHPPREHVRVARALGELRLVDEAFASGKLSYSKARAIARAATPETEPYFLEIAMHTTAAQLERLASAYRRTRIDPKQPNLDMRRFARRRETLGGMVRIELQLPPEQANIVWEAMFAALDSGRREGAKVAPHSGTPSVRSVGASAEASRAEADPAVMKDRQKLERWLQDKPGVERFPGWDGSELDLEYVVNTVFAGR